MYAKKDRQHLGLPLEPSQHEYKTLVGTGAQDAVPFMPNKAVGEIQVHAHQPDIEGIFDEPVDRRGTTGHDFPAERNSRERQYPEGDQLQDGHEKMLVVLWGDPQRGI